MSVSLTSPGNQTNSDGDVVAIQLAATDNAGRPLVYSVDPSTPLPSGLTLDPGSGRIYGEIGVGDDETSPYTVTLIASDNAAETSTQQTITWTVDAATPPSYESVTTLENTPVALTTTDFGMTCCDSDVEITTLPNGNGTLYEAVAQGNAQSPAPLQITFNTAALGTSVITLNNGALDTLTGNFNIIGPGPGTPGFTIQVPANRQIRIFTVANGARASISNLILQNGNAPAVAGQPRDLSGGAIANMGPLNLYYVNFYNNTARGNGGAIFNYGTATVQACAFQWNQATGLGGAVYNTGTMTIAAASDFAANDAGSGGAIYNAAPIFTGRSGGILTISGNTQIYANRALGTGRAPAQGVLAGVGGGIANLGTMSVYGAAVTANESVAQGGGIFTRGSTTLFVVSIQDNRAYGTVTGLGGGIYVAVGVTGLPSVLNLVGGCGIGNVTANVAEGSPDQAGICWAAGAGSGVTLNLLSNAIADSWGQAP